MASLHRIEALAGAGRWAVTFRREDSAEQTAVVQVEGSTATAAAAALPPGWAPGSAPFQALTDALLALQHARPTEGVRAALRDAPGGWDVMMGNVVLTADSDDGAQDSIPVCVVHGPLQPVPADLAGLFECPECGAKAVLD